VNFSIACWLQSQGHYSSIAKIINVWRSSGNAFKIRRAYCLKTGNAKALKRLPPRPLKGRWGSIASAEDFILEAGYEHLPSAFAYVSCNIFNSFFGTHES